MAIISQDAIKLGCSGGQGKIQIQTLFVLGTPRGDHASQLVLQCRKAWPSPLSRILYKSAYFFAKQSQFRKTQMNANLCGKKDCEKGQRGVFRKNKPNQSQLQNRRQKTEDGRQMSENRGQIMEAYPPEARQRTVCPAGTASNYDMQPTRAKKVLTGISCALISSGYELCVCDCLRGILCV